MKILDTPRINRCGNQVFYISPFGQCARSYCCPKNTITEARQYVRSGFGYYSRAWRTMLTEASRQAWIVAGRKVPTAKTLNQSGWRSGQQHLVAVNVSQFRVGEAPLWLPPDPVVFGPNPVGQLTAADGENGVRLMLDVTGPVSEKIMVFGQAPCSAGRMKRRNVSYLGLVSSPIAGVSDITDLYTARYGEPKPGEKVFIVTRQQKNGWEGPPKETSAIIPGLLESPGSALHSPQSEANSVSPVTAEAHQAPAEAALPLKAHVYNGCTPGTQRNSQTPLSYSPARNTVMTKEGRPNDEAEKGGREARKEGPGASGVAGKEGRGPG